MKKIRDIVMQEMYVVFVPLKKRETGKVEYLKVGWDWEFALFGWTGLPFLKRWLHGWGRHYIVFVVISFGGMAVAMFLNDSFYNSVEPFQFVASATGMTLLMECCINYIGDNKKTLELHLKNGWEFVEPDSDDVKFIKTKWMMS